MVDVLLTVLVGLTQFALAGMGGYVSLNPPTSHKKWVAAFVAIGIIGIVLTGLQAKRSNDALNIIAKNTEAAKGRSVSEGVKIDIKNKLAKYAGTKFEIETRTNDDEAMEYAQQILGALDNAGWDGGEYLGSVLRGGKSVNGLVITTPTQDSPPAVALMSVLYDNGIPFVWVHEPLGPGYVLAIEVGVKPTQ